jgi:hypothetical protein
MLIEVLPTGVPSGVGTNATIGLSLVDVARQAVTVTRQYIGLTKAYNADSAVQGLAAEYVVLSMVNQE